MPRRVWNLVAGLLLLVTACSGGGGAEEPQPQTVDNPVRVRVSNNYPLPIEVFAIGAGTTHRMGTVHPGMSGEFVLPQNLLGSGGVELQAKPSAESQTFRSEPLILAPGTVVDFAITPQLFNSTVTLRR